MLDVGFYVWALDEGCRLGSGVGFKVWTLCALYVSFGYDLSVCVCVRFNVGLGWALALGLV